MGFLSLRPIPGVLAELDELRSAALAALGDLADGVEIETATLPGRQVARRCIYGVDRTGMAVELARLTEPVPERAARAPGPRSPRTTCTSSAGWRSSRRFSHAKPPAPVIEPPSEPLAGHGKPQPFSKVELCLCAGDAWLNGASTGRGTTQWETPLVR